VSDLELREQFVAAVISERNCDRAEAEVIMARIADRLDGYTHDEAVERNPLSAPLSDLADSSSG
jgi:hypothetical protein